MNRPIFKKGDIVVHTLTGVVCEVKAVASKATYQKRLYNILIKRSHRGFSEWMNSEYYTLKELYDSPLYKALS